MRMKMDYLKKLRFKISGHISGQKHQSKLQTRFIKSVLIPPFIILALLGILVLWRLDHVVRNQAFSELSRSANTTAAKLEREFAIRQTVLKRTGEELFSIKSDYTASKTQLDNNRAICGTYVKQKKTFQGAPSNACDPFLPAFAREGITQAAVEDGYVQLGPELLKTQSDEIKQRLDAFSQFFPETLGIIVLDSNGTAISSAFKGGVNDQNGTLAKVAKDAIKGPVEGKTVNLQGYHMALFAYPITKGSVLAAYNLDSDSFLKNTWETTPIDRHQSLAAILDADGNLAYPNINIGNAFTSQNQNLRAKQQITVSINGVPNIVTGAQAGSSKWLVAVASPTEVVLAPVRDAQLAAVFVIGCLLLGFLWVGTYYIHRAINSIVGLVGGALVFASGKLDYKIKLDNPAEEFTLLAKTMNAMAERIARAEKELDEKNKEFISVATHELRTPLTAILGNLSMAYEDMGDKLDPMIKPLIGQAHSSTVRMRDLVNDMLDIARLESGRTEFRIVSTDIRAITQNVVDSLQVVAKEKGVSLTYAGNANQHVLADEPHLRIILSNFISNSIKYNRPNGTVTVSHVLKDNKLITTVADTGLGIPDDQKAHMFEKFFRVTHEDRKDIVGTGLGMYITKQYILAMHGEVWFESAHGKGTTFYFSLPVAAQSVSAPISAPHQALSPQTLMAVSSQNQPKNS